MGCDIHVRLEKLMTIKEKEKWINCDNWTFNPYFGEYSDETIEYEVNEFYDGRNYELFALLADVRNYGDIIPISKPKGVPLDMHYRTREEYESWECDAHSASWYTFGELINRYNEGDSLNYFVDKFKDRLCEEFRIHDFYEGEKKKELILKNANKIRVIFWFDN